MISIFYIGNIVLLLAGLSSTVLSILTGRNLQDKSFNKLKVNAIWFFALISVYAASRFIMETNETEVEVLATLQMLLLYICLTAFTILTTKKANRAYANSIATWGMLLQFPLLFLLMNIATRATGTYNYIFHISQIADPIKQGTNPVIAIGRICCFALLFSHYIILLLVFLDTHNHSQQNSKENSPNENSTWQPRSLDTRAEIACLLAIIAVTIAHLTPSPFVSLAACACLAAASVNYTLRMHKLSVSIKRELAGVTRTKLVRQRIASIIDNATSLEPIFGGKTTMTSIAQLLDVDEQELSEYIYKDLELSFSTWVSDKRLDFCSRTLIDTDRKVLDIAISAGYSDTAAMSKAFKSRFGLPPTEYRKQMRTAEQVAEILKSKASSAEEEQQD